MKRILLLASIIGYSTLSQAQLATINENFDSFVSATPSFPQNNWTMNVPVAFQNLMMVINEDGNNKFVQAYAFSQINVPHYLISPQIVAPNGTKTLSFEASKFTQSSFMGTIEVGLVNSPTDMGSFTSLGPATTLQTTIPQIFTYTVPNSTQQYIAFKFVGQNSHASTKLDNVTYGTNLSVNDARKSSQLTFAVSGNEMKFVGKTSVKELNLYDSTGRMVKVDKNGNNIFNISNLASGVYLFETKNEDGSHLKSKFIKK